MHFRPNVNFSFAFDQLKDAMKRAEQERAKNTLISYAAAHGILYGAVEGVITFVEDPDDITEALTGMPDNDYQIEKEISK